MSAPRVIVRSGRLGLGLAALAACLATACSGGEAAAQSDAAAERPDSTTAAEDHVAMPVPLPYQTGITQLADLHLATTLVGPNGSECTIVIPEGPLFLDLAEQIRATVRDGCGVDLPIQRDAESLEVLTQRNAIVLGCLANNRLVERLYLDWFTLCDRWYPGPGGWLIRTIHDPYGTGRNAVLLGASEDALLASAVTAFCARLEPGPVCRIGRIWDIHLGQGMELKPEVDSIGLFHPFNDRDPGLGLSKAFQQALRYWYTGDEFYAQQFMRRVAADPDRIATAEHYQAHKHALLWDVVEESPSFSDEQRLLVVNALLGHLRSAESAAAPGIASWLAEPNPKRLMERHGMVAALCALGEARYFQTHYPSPEFDDILGRVDRYFARQMTHGKGWKDENDLHTYLEMPLLYAVLRRNPAFRESGALRLFADRCVQYCSNLGGAETYPFYLLRMVGYLLRDPGYVYVADMRLRAEQSLGPLSVHEFVGPQAFADDQVPLPPPHHSGVLATPVDPVEHWVYGYPLPIEQGFDKLVFRAGFGVADDYLLVDGVARVDDKANYAARDLKEFAGAGHAFLAGYTNCTVLERQSFAHHSLVTVTCDGQAELPPMLGERVCVGQVGGLGYAHLRLDPYVRSAYDRRLFWVPNRWLIVCDSLTADRAGDYALQCNWLLPGDGEQTEPGYRATVGTGEGQRACQGRCGQRYPLRITRSRIPFRLYAATSFPYFGYDVTRVAQVVAGRLEKGETREFTNLLHIEGPGRPAHLEVRTLAPGVAVLSGDDTTALVVSARPLDDPDSGLSVDADGAVLTESRAVLFACRRFAWHGLGLRFSALADVAWDLTAGTLEVNASEATEVTVDGVTALDLDGTPVATGPHPGTVRVELAAGLHHLTGPVTASLEGRRDAMGRAIDRAAAAQAPSPRPNTTAAALPPLCSVSLPSPVTALAVLPGADGVLVLAGDAEGTVQALRDGRTEWTFATGGRIECLAVDRLDGEPVVLAGSADEHLYRLDSSGHEAWRVKLDGDYTWEWWTLGCRSPVQAILTTDLFGDGRRQIIVGHGGMQLQLFAADGTPAWRQSWHYGIPTTLVAVDADGDGTKEIMAGGWIRSSTSWVKSFRHDGTPIRGDLYDAGRTHRGFDCAGVPFLRYYRDGAALRAVVARSGPYCDLGLYDHGSQELLWHRVVGDTVSGLELLDTPGQGLPDIAYATRAGWVVAMDCAGGTRWARQLTHAVAALGQWGDRIVAACQDGQVFCLDRSGALTGGARTEPGAVCLAVAPDPSGLTLVVGSGSRVAIFGP